MNFGTKGCMYNCGEECTGECIKVETKTKMMSKEELIEEILDIIHSENSGLSIHQRVSEIEKVLNQNKEDEK